MTILLTTLAVFQHIVGDEPIWNGPEGDGTE